MADTVKTTKQLKLQAGFVDGDDRTLTFDNPSDGLTKADIMDINEDAAVCLIGDKTGAAFDSWKSAKIVETQTTYLDLN